MSLKDLEKDLEKILRSSSRVSIGWSGGWVNIEGTTDEEIKRSFTVGALEELDGNEYMVFEHVADYNEGAYSVPPIVFKITSRGDPYIYNWSVLRRTHNPKIVGHFHKKLIQAYEKERKKSIS